MSNAFDAAINTIRRHAEAYRLEIEAARCPMAEAIIMANMGQRPRHGMTGALDVFCALLSSSTAKRKAAEQIVAMRRNRVALAEMNRNPYAADEIFLRRAADYRREAIRLKRMGL